MNQEFDLEKFNDLNIEIQKINSDFEAICLETIPFEKLDFVVAFIAGLLEITTHYITSDTNNINSLVRKLSNKSTDIGKLFNEIHESIGHAGQPLDYQGKNFGGGDHRVLTFGHDLLMLPLALYMLQKGEFIDGYYDNNEFIEIIRSKNQFGTDYDELTILEAILAWIKHICADFFSSKGLPIPGYSFLTHFPDENVRLMAIDLYKDGLNLRNLLLQGVAVAVTEIIIRIYIYLKYKDSKYSKEQKISKQNKLLLLSHGFATAINVGQIVISEEISSLNIFIIIRTMILLLENIKEDIILKEKILRRTTLSSIKLQVETMKTLVLLNGTVQYTSKVNKTFFYEENQFYYTNNERKHLLTENIDALNIMLQELKRLNQ